ERDQSTPQAFAAVICANTDRNHLVTLDLHTGRTISAARAASAQEPCGPTASTLKNRLPLSMLKALDPVIDTFGPRAKNGDTLQVPLNSIYGFNDRSASFGFCQKSLHSGSFCKDMTHRANEVLWREMITIKWAWLGRGRDK